MIPKKATKALLKHLLWKSETTILQTPRPEIHYTWYILVTLSKQQTRKLRDRILFTHGFSNTIFFKVLAKFLTCLDREQFPIQFQLQFNYFLNNLSAIFGIPNAPEYSFPCVSLYRCILYQSYLCYHLH